MPDVCPAVAASAGVLLVIIEAIIPCLLLNSNRHGIFRTVASDVRNRVSSTGIRACLEVSGGERLVALTECSADSDNYRRYHNAQSISSKSRYLADNNKVMMFSRDGIVNLQLCLS